MSLPAPKDVRDLFAELLNRPVEVGTAAPMLAEDVPRTMVTIYVDDTLKMTTVIGLELPLAVYAGAALGLVPPGGAQDSVAEGVLSPMIAENAAEVCNIMAGLLNRPGGPRIRMYQTYLPGERPPTDATGYLLALGRRLDLTVDVAGYGTGRLSVTLAT